MAKTTGAFKLSKEAKRALAIIKNSHQRGAWKKALVDAEYASQQQPRRSKEKSN